MRCEGTTDRLQLIKTIKFAQSFPELSYLARQESAKAVGRRMHRLHKNAASHARFAA